MKTTLIQLLIASSITVAAGTAFAENAYQGSWYLVPGIGLLNTDKDLHADRTAPAAFLRLGKELSQHWDMQLGASYGKADSEHSFFGHPLSGEYKQTLIGVDALYLFRRDKLRPFLLAGVGYAHNDVDFSSLGHSVGDTKDSWMANVGAGLQYYFTDNIGLQADVRSVWSRAKGGRNSHGFTVKEGTIDNYYLNLGVIFNFGAPKKLAAAESSAPALQAMAHAEGEALPPLVAEEMP